MIWTRVCHKPFLHIIVRLSLSISLLFDTLHSLTLPHPPSFSLSPLPAPLYLAPSLPFPLPPSRLSLRLTRPSPPHPMSLPMFSYSFLVLSLPPSPSPSFSLPHSGSSSRSRSVHVRVGSHIDSAVLADHPYIGPDPVRPYWKANRVPSYRRRRSGRPYDASTASQAAGSFRVGPRMLPSSSRHGLDNACPSCRHVGCMVPVRPASSGITTH